jgi:hypothetical protein
MIMQQLAFNPCFMLHILMFTIAKFESYKTGSLENYIELVCNAIPELASNRLYYLTNFRYVAFDIYLLELLSNTLIVPDSSKFYHRFAHAASFSQNSLKYNFGLYLLFICRFYTSINFKFT